MTFLALVAFAQSEGITMDNYIKKPATEIATLAAGCFWGVQHLLDQIPGVIKTRAGYTGGTTGNPTYEDVCTDDTGHAEAVEVEFDPSIVSYEEILSYFWRLHDPTTVDRQGPDMGSQYRSAIFFHTQKQKEIAEKSKAKFDKSGVFKNRAVTQIAPATRFYPAEEYHQNYFKKHSSRACHILRDK